MLYDVRLDLHYDYDYPVRGDRHLIRVMPVSLPHVQRVIAASLTFAPRPSHEVTFSDFFDNLVTAIAFDASHDHLDVRLSARVNVEERRAQADHSPPLETLRQEIGRIWSVRPGSPHHYLAASPRVMIDPAITAYAKKSFARTATVQAGVMDFCLSIHQDFEYEAGATQVDTMPAEAFAIRKGVCQDFSHVMIAGLRGMGVPAGYVSGFLRTLPPPGKPRLEGADAMHAWVRAWCGPQAGWIEFDPTNAMIAGSDHITIGHGRDYADISPIVGVLKTSGGHEARQAVDVVLVE